MTAPAPADPADVPVPADLPMKMVLAMIASAAADGTIDTKEMDALATAIGQAPVDNAEKARLTAALNQPPTVEEVAALATAPEEASEIYGAALTAVDADSPAEHLFLRRLATALHLDPGLRDALHAEAGVA